MSGKRRVVGGDLDWEGKWWLVEHCLAIAIGTIIGFLIWQLAS